MKKEDQVYNEFIFLGKKSKDRKDKKSKHKKRSRSRSRSRDHKKKKHWRMMHLINILYLIYDLKNQNFS